MRIRSAESWARLVRERRRAAGMTQAELAEQIGASQRWVAKFESGSPTAQLQLALAAAAAVGLVIEANALDDAPHSETLPRGVPDA